MTKLKCVSDTVSSRRTRSNSPQPNSADVSLADAVCALDGLYMNIATPVVIISTNKYFSHGYFLCASSTPSTITGIGFTDLPNTFVVHAAHVTSSYIQL